MPEQPIAAGKSSFDLIDAGRLFEALRLAPDTRLLDLACGRGNYTLAACAHIGPAGRIWAVDLWPEGIDLLARESGARGLTQVHAEVADVSRRIPLAAASVDVCLMATVLHDLVADGTDAGTLTEVERVVRPGGRLAVVEFKTIDGPPGPPLKLRLAPDDVARRLAPHGFTPDTTVSVGPSNYLALFTRERRP